MRSVSSILTLRSHDCTSSVQSRQRDRGHSADHGDCVRSGSCIDGPDQARSAVRTGGAVHLLAPLMTQ